MLYASFRCLMKAPVATIWQRLNEKLKNPIGRFDEQLIVNPDRREIVLRLREAQPLSGERRFVIRSGAEETETVVDAILSWTGDLKNPPVPIDALVRDVLLELKRESEAP